MSVVSALGWKFGQAKLTSFGFFRRAKTASNNSSQWWSGCKLEIFSDMFFRPLYVNNLREVLVACVNGSDEGWNKLPECLWSRFMWLKPKVFLYSICVRSSHVGNNSCSWLARFCGTYHEGIKVKVCIRAIRPDRPYTKYFYSPLNEMLVHHRATQALNLLALIYTPGWREALCG